MTRLKGAVGGCGQEGLQVGPAFLLTPPSSPPLPLRFGGRPLDLTPQSDNGLLPNAGRHLWLTPDKRREDSEVARARAHDRGPTRAPPAPRPPRFHILADRQAVRGPAHPRRMYERAHTHACASMCMLTLFYDEGARGEAGYGRDAQLTRKLMNRCPPHIPNSYPRRAWGVPNLHRHLRSVVQKLSTREPGQLRSPTGSPGELFGTCGGKLA